MRPSSSLSTQRPDIADAFQEYNMLAQSRGYVGLNLYPQLDVTAQAGNFGLLPLEQFKRTFVDSDLARAPNGGYTKIDWKFETSTYTTQEYGIEVPIDEREAAMYAGYCDPAMISADIARLSLLDALESRILTAVLAGVGANSAVTTAWTTFASAVPVTDIFTAMKSIYNSTGLQADTIAMSWKDIFHMKMCAQFQDFFKYTMQSTPGDISLSDIARCFGVRQVLASGVSLNTAAEDVTTATMSPALTAGVIFVGVCAPSANSSLKYPSMGRVFHWTGDGSRVDGAPEEYYAEDRRSRVMRLRHDLQVKTLYGALGYKLTGASS